MLNSIYGKHPELDTNSDKVLTESEYRAFQMQHFYGKPEHNLSGYYDYIKDIPYLNDSNKSYVLDVIIPENRLAEKLPVLVFIHGGGWKGGTKTTGLQVLDPILKSGNFIGVSINYRLSGEAKWPAQIYDCNAAIRWIKANAETYGIDKNKLAVWGTSAGGHLAMMLALTSESGKFNGTVGNHLDESSTVTCAIDGFGPTDLLMKGSFLAELVHNDPKELKYNTYNLLEGIEEQAKNASPINWVSSVAKPLFIYHGTADTTVDIAHSENMVEALNHQGIKTVYLTKVRGMEHELFMNDGMVDRIFNFLNKYLYDEKVDLTETISIEK